MALIDGDLQFKRLHHATVAAFEILIVNSGNYIKKSIIRKSINEVDSVALQKKLCFRQNQLVICEK